MWIASILIRSGIGSLRSFFRSSMASRLRRSLYRASKPDLQIHVVRMLSQQELIAIRGQIKASLASQPASSGELIFLGKRRRLAFP